MFENLDNDELLRTALDAINHARNAEAVSLLKTLLERDPEHVFGLYLLAAEHMQLGMADRAEAGFVRVVELAPDFPIARFQLGQFYLVKGDAASAITTLAPLAALPAGTALSYYAKGLIAAARGDTTTALEELRSGLGSVQDVPALAGDMQQMLNSLVVLQGDAAIDPVPHAVAGAGVPLYLSGYSRAGS